MGRFLFALGALLAGCAAEPPLSPSPVVEHVESGDTLVLSTGRTIGIAGIAAPQSCQFFGPASTASLARLCFGRRAEIDPAGTDSRGRSVARVVCAGTDAATHQVMAGLAWVDAERVPNASALYALQRSAIGSGRGLWADGNPVAPWDFRRLNGPCPPAAKHDP
jgi:endonuclease YncB( thermonuclease family)